jgi:hypothetical protein
MSIYLLLISSVDLYVLNATYNISGKFQCLLLIVPYLIYNNLVISVFITINHFHDVVRNLVIQPLDGIAHFSRPTRKKRLVFGWGQLFARNTESWLTLL